MARIELGTVEAADKKLIEKAAALDERPVAWWARRALRLAATGRIEYGARGEYVEKPPKEPPDEAS